MHVRMYVHLCICVYVFKCKRVYMCLVICIRFYVSGNLNLFTVHTVMYVHTYICIKGILLCVLVRGIIHHPV